MSEEKIYQPGWGEKKHHHHHHHHHGPNEKNRGWGGALRMRDKSAYYGLMVILTLGLGYGAYLVVDMYLTELRAMPMDDPKTEMAVDELRIRKVQENEALAVGDSMTRALNLDSIRHTVQIDTKPVYRPPRREKTWYLTQRDWKAIKQNYRIWRWERKREKEEGKE